MSQPIMLAMQTPGMGPRELETVAGLCPELLSREKRGSKSEFPCFNIHLNPLLALVWGSVPRRGTAEGLAMAGISSSCFPLLFQFFLQRKSEKPPR